MVNKYTFEDWLKGEPEDWSNFHFDDSTVSKLKFEIFEHKLKAFDKLVRINVTWVTRFIKAEIDRIQDQNDRVLFLNTQISIYEQKIAGVSRVKIMRGPYYWDLEFIDGILYRKIMDFIIPDGESFITIPTKDQFCNSTIAHKVIREIEQIIIDLEEHQITKQPASSSKGKKLNAPIRYLILEDFFDLKKEYKNLLERQKIELISKILGINERMAKGLKNGELRYFSEEIKTDASDLINKIKKGPF